MKTFGFFNIILVVLLFITLITFPFFKVINSNFRDVPSMLNFLSRANVYNNASQIVKLEVQAYYPERIKNNFVLYGLANKLVDYVVTPGLIEKAATPALRATVAFAQAPTSIVSNKVVVQTAPYKAQASSTIGELGLPRILVNTINLAINSVPTQLTLVNLEKHPNSPLAMIIRARTLLQHNETLLVVTTFAMFFLWVVLIVYNMRHIKKLFEAIWLSLGSAFILVLILSLLIPWVVSMNLPGGANALGVAQNNLVTDIVNYFVNQIQAIMWWYAGFAVVSFVVWRFVKFEKIQSKLDKFLKKLHIPTVEVKIHETK